MIEIRKLTESDMQQAIKLKVLCWTEQLVEKAENTLSVSKELAFWVEWMHTAKENNDIRLLLGAFEDGKLLGVAFSSLAETFDIPEKGIELNGLWVYPEHRGKGISLMLVTHLLDFYTKKGMEKIVIYNHHYSPSNKFYLKFGAKVERQDYQMDGKLLVDIFIADIDKLNTNMMLSLQKYLTS